MGKLYNGWWMQENFLPGPQNSLIGVLLLGLESFGEISRPTSKLLKLEREKGKSMQPVVRRQRAAKQLMYV